MTFRDTIYILGLSVIFALFVATGIVPLEALVLDFVAAAAAVGYRRFNRPSRMITLDLKQPRGKKKVIHPIAA